MRLGRQYAGFRLSAYNYKTVKTRRNRATLCLGNFCFFRPTMAPTGSFLSMSLPRSLSAVGSVSDYISAQWQNPSGIFSVLMLVGPGIVEKAIAQLVGRGITPVAFSFGWVAYSANALLSAISRKYQSTVYFLTVFRSVVHCTGSSVTLNFVLFFRTITDGNRRKVDA
jgi:hypothetical protein